MEKQRHVSGVERPQLRQAKLWRKSAQAEMEEEEDNRVGTMELQVEFEEDQLVEPWQVEP